MVPTSDAVIEAQMPHRLYVNNLFWGYPSQYHILPLSNGPVLYRAICGAQQIVGLLSFTRMMA